MKPIDQPLKQIFEFESSYCLCVGGIPNRPDNTIIEGLGQTPKIEVPANDFYQILENQPEFTQISEPSLGLISTCLLTLAMTLIKRG